VSRLVVVLSPWMIASVGVNVSFPLAFVVGRLRLLPLIGAVALVAQLLLAWIGSELFELDGLAVSLALTTLLVLGLLLRELDAVSPGLWGIARAAVVIAGVAVIAFLPLGLAVGSVAAAIAGVAVYAGVLAVWRPAGLTGSWSYLRALR
jgi:hypothetical protein